MCPGTTVGKTCEIYVEASPARSSDRLNFLWLNRSVGNRETILLKPALLLVISIGVFGLAGCGSSEQPDEMSVKEGSQPEGGESSAGTKDTPLSSTAEDAAPAPKYITPTMDNLRGKPYQFPSEYGLQKYPNSKVIFAQVYPTYRMNQPNMVALESRDRIESIAAFYKNKLPKEGWMFKRKNENAAFSSTIWTKGKEQAEIRVSPTPNSESWCVQLLIGPITR